MTLAVMEEILVSEGQTERSNDGRSTALTEEIELRVRRERHRRWRPEEKLRIVQETLRPSQVIAAVAGSGTLLALTRSRITTDGVVATLVASDTQILENSDQPQPLTSRQQVVRC